MSKRVVSFFILIIVSVGLVCAVFYGTSRTYSECFVEAGVPVDIEDFLKSDNLNASFSPNSEPYDINTPGDYQVLIKVFGLTNRTTLHVIDTTAPVVVSKDVSLDYGAKCLPEDFIESIEDITETKVSFAKEPDYNSIGQQEVELLVADLAGNETKVNASLVISIVRPEINVEVGGEAPSPSDFVVVGDEIVIDEEYLFSIDYSVLGDYNIDITVDGVDYVSALHVVDTIPPVVSYKNLSSFTKLPRQPEDFIVRASDATKLYYRFENTPDLSKEGEQKLTVIVTDEGGNEVSSQVKLTLKKDTESPVISGVKDITTLLGSSISYKTGVTVTDNCMERLSFTVDNSKVNPNAEGTYPITYIAKDYSGNETRIDATVKIQTPRYDDVTINALADEVVARIITPDMSAEDKCKAIYDYCKNNIGYISHSDKGNWFKAAYEGFMDRKGDCYVYACTAKALLTRAGVPNMDIEKIPAKTRHYWNLVDVGNGWVHFDTTPRKDHPYIFLWNDDKLMKYSSRHGNSHNYDHEVYDYVK